MSGTTTIQITNEQKSVLDRLKEHDGEPYKSVLQKLITHYEANGGVDKPIDEERVREIANDVVDDRINDE